jgi:hypothetical protein
MHSMQTPSISVPQGVARCGSMRRLHTIRALVGAGIPVGVSVSPPMAVPEPQATQLEFGRIQAAVHGGTNEFFLRR